MEREAAQGPAGGPSAESIPPTRLATGQHVDWPVLASAIGNRAFGTAARGSGSSLRRTLLQRDSVGGMAEIYCREPAKQVRALIDKAASRGLPTRFLSIVSKGYRIHEADVGEAETNEVFNQITFKPGTTERGLKAMQMGPTAESASLAEDLGTIFHEALHAYLDLLENDPKVQAFLEAGRLHYEGATVGDKITASPEILFSEAAGNYVGNRILYWWRTLVDLALLVARGPVSEASLDEVRHAYEERTAERIFGYVVGEGGTDRAMSDDIKQFLDSEILEGKIPDKFDDVPAFRQLVSG